MRIADESSGVEELALELTPMIDVVFLLLIFFMVATTFLDPEREIDIDLPQADAAQVKQSESDELVINVFRDGRVSLGGRELADEALRAELVRAARREPKPTVTIRGDRQAHHEAIVRVMDACSVAGLADLSVGTIEGR